MSEILFGIPSPFDYRLVEKHQPNQKCDRIIPKYYTEVQAYKIIRDYFIDHRKYTHLAIACSDIVVLDQHITQAYKNIKEFDWPVFSGVMNIALEYLNILNVTKNWVHPQQLVYDWYTREEIDPQNPIWQVKWSGFPFMVLKRDIVEQFEFESLSSYNKIDSENKVGCLDVIICHKFNENNIPIHADTRINLLHLKEVQEESQPTLVGKKDPVIYFWFNGKREKTQL